MRGQTVLWLPVDLRQQVEEELETLISPSLPHIAKFPLVCNSLCTSLPSAQAAHQLLAWMEGHELVWLEESFFHKT